MSDSKKGQNHTNTFYFSQFHEKYTSTSVLDIIKTLNVMITHVPDQDIFGFGIYFKSNNNEFTIVLKLKDVKALNWCQLTYIREGTGWVNIIKQGDLGPQKLYEGLISRGNYTFKTNPPHQYPVGNPIAGINPYFSSSQDVEYNLSKFVKYGGNRRISKRHSFKKSRKQLRGGRKTSKKQF
jgi:hypothetical protein